jgi:sulfur-oxidizing protein SoxY
MISRRVFCLSASLAPLAGLPGLAWGQEADDPWPDIRDALFGQRAIAENDGIISVEAPKRAYDAAIVPVTVHAAIPQTADRYIKSVHLIIDKNPAPEAAIFHFTIDSGDATFSTRVRVNEYTNVRAVAELNDGSLHMAVQFVKAAGGCSAPALKDQEMAFANMGKMKLRQPEQVALNQPNQAQLLVSHPNFSGMQFDQISRNYIPAHFIREVTVRYGGRTVMTVEGNISLSEDPSFHFNYVPTAEAEMSVEVVDSDGMKFSQAWPVAPAPSL